MAEALKLSVIIPVYNEERTLDQIVARLRELPLPMEIICVNDCSTDGSGARLDALLAFHEREDSFLGAPCLEAAAWSDSVAMEGAGTVMASHEMAVFE